MTIQQLEYIIAVDKYRHFVRAAESCGVTQSTLSSLIQKFEAELDVVIFDRNSHPVKPTAVGEDIISQAKVVLFNVSQLKENVLSIKGQESGRLKMGMASTIAPYVLPGMLKNLSSSYPDVQLSVTEARVPAIIEKLEKAELDVALLAMPVDNDNLLEIPVYKEKFVAYVCEGENLFKQEKLCMKRLSTENLWVLREGYCPNSGNFAFCKSGTGKAAIYEAGSIETLVRIVDQNGGFTIIPELHVPLLNETQLKNVRPLCNPEPSREIAFVVRKDFVRVRMLNIIAEAVKKVIPDSMINERLKKYAIKL